MNTKVWGRDGFRSRFRSAYPRAARLDALTPGQAWGRAKFAASLMFTLFVLCVALAVVLPFSAEAAGWNSNAPVALTRQGVSTVTASPGAAAAGQSLNDLLAGRTYTPKTGADAGGVRLSDLLKTPYVPKDNVPVSAARDLPWKAIAKGVARSLPLISTAVAIQDIYEALRCRERFGGGAECDPGEPQEERTLQCVTASFGDWYDPGTDIWHTGFLNRQICGGSAGDLVGSVSSAISSTGRQVRGMGYSGAFPLGGVYGETKTPPASFWSPVSLSGSPSTGLVCPRGGAVGSDGLCATQQYEPTPEPALAEKIEQHGDKTKAVPAVQAMDLASIPMEHQAPSFQVPPVVQGERTTTTHPDGSVTVRDVEWPMEATPEGYKWRETVREQTYPPGVEVPPQGTPGTGGGGTTTTGNPTELFTCGLPNTPPCKIDESGTPSGVGALHDGNVARDVARDSIIAGMAEPTELPWVWGFDLPVGSCSNLQVPAGLVPGSQAREFDLCGHPATPIWRQLFAWVLYVGAAFYAWHRYTDQVGAR